MADVGLYLSGAGSLDGSDAMAAVLAYQALQSTGFEPLPIGRDVEQGRVVDHRTAQPQDQVRNALSESARLVRGNVRDMRDVDAEDLSGALLVGGDGTLSTWTDYHERGEECRITERLKYHLLELIGEDKTVLCLGNAGFVVAQFFRDRDGSPRLNVGSSSSLNSVVERWGVSLSDESPSWDADYSIGCLPEVTRTENLPRSFDRLSQFIGEYV